MAGMASQLHHFGGVDCDQLNRFVSMICLLE